MNGVTTAWAPARAAAIYEQEPTGLMAVGFWCFAFFLFAFYSRLFDLYLSFLHLPAATQLIALVVAVFSGRILCWLGAPVGRCMLGLTAWLILCIPFSAWRGGSIEVLANDWLKSVVIFMIASALIVTFNQGRRALFVIGLATAAGALLVTLKGHMDEGGGRLSMEGSRYQNANEIAMMMVIGLPLLGLLITDSRANPFRRAACLGLAMVVLGTMMRTGSRSGLLGLMVLMILTFVRLPMGGKAAMFLGTLLAGLLFVVVVPHSIKERYLTLVHAEQDAANAVEAQQVGKAEASAAARWDKFILSLQLTATHPLFGVGPGNFAVVIDNSTHQEGRYSDWTGTHNSYTQIASEAGIPALLLFVAILALSVKSLTRIARRARKLNSAAGRDFANTAFALRDSFVVFMVCAWFAHVAYQATMPVMAALAMALVRAAEAELPALEAPMREVAAAPIPRAWPPPRPWVKPAVTLSGQSRSSFG